MPTRAPRPARGSTNRSPTRAEIAGAFGFASPNAAEDHLRALAKKGAITLEPGSARGIRLVEQLGLPLIGTVAAGSPLLAVENRLGNIRIDPALFQPQADFLLRVRGLSMIEAGILDGDYVVARAQPEANQGEMVVAGIPGGEATVKTYKRDGDQVVLVPANAAYEPMVFSPDEVTLYGKVVTVMRKV